MGIDAVITYVNMDDPNWINGYKKNVGSLNQDKVVNNVSRFRDYGGLRACLRSIAQYAPWINNIYLVVQLDSQVPDWINRDEIKVVLHEEFIPKEVLPTYSAFSIELFLHLIPGISERFLYFNDDMILTRPVVEEEFFLGNLPVHCLKTSRTITVTKEDYQCKETACGDFNIPIKNAWRLAQKAAGVDMPNAMVSDHGVYSFTKSINNECYEKIKDDIIDSCTKLRSHKSVICGIYLYYAYMVNKFVNVGPRTKEVHFTEGELYHVVSNIFNTVWQCVCINDRNVTSYELAKELTQDALFTRFNTPSKYESC